MERLFQFRKHLRLKRSDDAGEGAQMQGGHECTHATATAPPAPNAAKNSRQCIGLQVASSATFRHHKLVEEELELEAARADGLELSEEQ